jgi:outer membrane protein assembly factor BamB
MQSRLFRAAVFAAVLVAGDFFVPFLLRAADVATEFNKNWPRWRGPAETGVAPHASPPADWSETKNIKWKVAMPGEGSGSPIIWGDRVFVTSAVDTGKAPAPRAAEPGAAPTPTPAGAPPGAPAGRSTEAEWRFVVSALNRADGKVIWEKTARTERPHEGVHQTGNFAPNSAVTDGEHIYAYFGSRGLYAYDFDGNLKWERDFGDMRIRYSFGEGSSPGLHGNTLVLIWDNEGESFIVAVDKYSGKELWRKTREEQTSWTTPLIVEDTAGRTHVITSATGQVRSYDLATGEILWTIGGMTFNAIPSPVYADGIVYLMSGFRGNALKAIRLADAKGDVAGTSALLWEFGQDTPYVPSPLLYDGILYFLKSNNAILSAFDAKTGKPHYGPQRVEPLTNIYASPVGAAGKVYITDRRGYTATIKAGPAFEVLATNKLDDVFDASAAVVDGEIYLRGVKSLYCIAAK